MSHFTSIKTRFTSAKHLLTAIKECGYKKVKYYKNPQLLDGVYWGSKRYANLIIRNDDYSDFMCDFGFKQMEDQTFSLEIEDSDRAKLPKGWNKELCRRYSYHVALDSLEEQGFTLAEETQGEDQSIRLLLRRMG